MNLSTVDYGGYRLENGHFRKKLFSPLKSLGYVPEKGSEIFVSGIPSTATIYELFDFFKSMGDLFQVKLMTKENGVDNRGFAYVTYMNKALAEKALRILNNRPFQNIFLSMQKSLDNCRIFIGGVPPQMSKDEIWQQLKNIYKIKNIVDVITYRNYGNPTYNRGFVFLEFRTHEEASYFRAKYWDKLYLFGRKLLVDWSLPIMDNEDTHLSKIFIMALPQMNYFYEDSPYRKVLYSPLKKSGFIPEKDSEIFVSGVPETATVYQLAAFFQQAGELFQAKLMVKGYGNINRGFAFITYMKKSDAEYAIKELKKKSFMGGVRIHMQRSIDNCRIFVGGVPVDKTKDEIWQTIKNSYGITNIVDIITYRNYSNPMYNRGFVFLEFRTHEEASYFRAKYADKLYLYGKQMLVDWSIPIMEIDAETLSQVKILFIRNLDVTQTSDEFARLIHDLMDKRFIEKIYKFKDYAYVHLSTRQNAERLMEILKRMYQGTLVEVLFAKPPNKFTTRNFRNQTLISRRRTTTTSPVYQQFPENAKLDLLPFSTSVPNTSHRRHSETTGLDLLQMSGLGSNNNLYRHIPQTAELDLLAFPGSSTGTTSYNRRMSQTAAGLDPLQIPRPIPNTAYRCVADNKRVFDLLPMANSSYPYTQNPAAGLDLLPVHAPPSYGDPLFLPHTASSSRMGSVHHLQQGAASMIPPYTINYEDLVNKIINES